MTLVCLAISVLPSLAWSMASSMYMLSCPAGLMKAWALLLHPVVKASPASPSGPAGVWSLRGLRPGRRESPVSAYQSMSFTARRIRSTAPSTPVRPALMTRS